MDDQFSPADGDQMAGPETAAFDEAAVPGMESRSAETAAGAALSAGFLPAGGKRVCHERGGPYSWEKFL